MIRSNRRILTGHTETGQTRFVETADFAGSGGAPSMGLPSGTGTTSIASPAINFPLLDGFVPQDRRSMNRLYREIYRNDGVTGTAIDMLSTLPFSDFSLTGMNDERRLAKFVQSVEKMGIRTLLKPLSVDYLVYGAYVGILNWNERERIFDGLASQSIDFCEFTPVPLVGADPLITLVFPPEIKKGLTSSDERLRKVIEERIPEALRNQMTGKGIKLEPKDVIFLGREGTTADFAGLSILERVLPIYLIEKALIRGTLDQAWKRQRGIMHIQAGDMEWQPTADEFTQLGQMFGNADHDPTGAIVVTRDGINVNEIRRGEDFWKYPDIYDWAVKAKLMALGISENMLTGDGSVTNVESNISVTLQYFSDYRERVTRELFYDKIFPTIAIENNFNRKQSIALSSQQQYLDGVMGLRDHDHYRSELGYRREADGTFTAEIGRRGTNDSQMLDRTKFDTPTVTWNTSLKPDNSSEYINMLGTLEEKGVPIPLRIWAAAGGMSIRDLVEQRTADTKLRKFFQPWYKEVLKYKQAVEGTGDEENPPLGGDSSGDFSGASAGESLMGREYDDSMDPYGFNHRGNRVPVSFERQKQISSDMNKKIAEAAATTHQTANAKLVEEQKAARRKTYSYKPTPKAGR